MAKGKGVGVERGMSGVTWRSALREDDMAIRKIVKVFLRKRGLAFLIPDPRVEYEHSYL
jgi:hypothetical protein